MTYSAVNAKQLSIGGGPNGSGKRKMIYGAYTIDEGGRKVRAFDDREGGFAAAQAWAEVLNSRQQ
jgi:alpha-D-ribose 1-methylphosphonate 5-triphosphate synthase subunit PhnL